MNSRYSSLYIDFVGNSQLLNFLSNFITHKHSKRLAQLKFKHFNTLMVFNKEVHNLRQNSTPCRFFTFPLHNRPLSGIPLIHLLIYSTILTTPLPSISIYHSETLLCLSDSRRFFICIILTIIFHNAITIDSLHCTFNTTKKPQSL